MTLHGANNLNSQGHAHSRRVWSSFVNVTRLGVLFNSWASSSELMAMILNAPEQEADAMMALWKGYKQSELQFVAVTVRIKARLSMSRIH
jgi:hypothetical protein